MTRRHDAPGGAPSTEHEPHVGSESAEHRVGTNEIEALAETVLDGANASGLGVIVCFRAGGVPRLVHVNDAASEVFGSASAELLGTPMLDLFSPVDRNALATALSHDRSSAEPPTIDAEALHQGGHGVPVELTFSQVVLADEPAVVCFLRDITERRLLQAELAARDRMATLGSLAAGVAHEINNPLGYLRLNVSTLIHQLERLTPAEHQEQLQPVIAATRDGLKRVATIVRDLQCLSSPQMTERWPVHACEVLDSAVNLAMHAIRGWARVERRYSEVSALKTDPTRVGQILLNLVTNAVQSFQHQDAHRNVISLLVEQRAPSGITITVADNGAGIARPHLERIFDPFFTTKRSGSGLGLAISRSLAASLGGSLAVASECGVGTQAMLSLPLLPPTPTKRELKAS